MDEIRRHIDQPYNEETELPILYRKKLPLWIRILRWWYERTR